MKTKVLLRTALTLALAALVGPVSATADPSRNTNPPVAFSCNGKPVVLTFTISGSHQAFVVGSDGSTSASDIFVITTLTFTGQDGTTVVYDTASGLTDLVSCTADLDGTILTATGFFTRS
jgi:hypothetical protein